MQIIYTLYVYFMLLSYFTSQFIIRFQKICLHIYTHYNCSSVNFRFTDNITIFKLHITEKIVYFHRKSRTTFYVELYIFFILMENVKIKIYYMVFFYIKNFYYYYLYRFLKLLYKYRQEQLKIIVKYQKSIKLKFINIRFFDCIMEKKLETDNFYD